MVASQNYGAGTDIVNHAPKRSDIAAQFVFKVARRAANGKGTKEQEYQYMRSSDDSIHKITKNLKFGGAVHTDNECLNIYVAWCGDGILDKNMVKNVILKILKKLDGEITDVMHLVSLSMRK